MKTEKENKAIAEILKRNEEVVSSYLKEMQDGLEEKRIDIDGIEEIMLKTMKTLKHGVIAATKCRFAI